MTAVGDSSTNPINKMSLPERAVVPPEKWGENLANVITWVATAWAAQIWLTVPAFMGDFESYFWYVKSMRDLLPPRV